jgi:TRAP-type mannitol/chloroaromatic compound transport system substrate-binding protein
MLIEVKDGILFKSVEIDGNKIKLKKVIQIFSPYSYLSTWYQSDRYIFVLRPKNSELCKDMKKLLHNSFKTSNINYSDRFKHNADTYRLEQVGYDDEFEEFRFLVKLIHTE